MNARREGPKMPDRTRRVPPDRRRRSRCTTSRREGKCNAVMTGRFGTAAGVQDPCGLGAPEHPQSSSEGRVGHRRAAPGGAFAPRGRGEAPQGGCRTVRGGGCRLCRRRCDRPASQSRTSDDQATARSIRARRGKAPCLLMARTGARDRLAADGLEAVPPGGSGG